MWRRAGFLTLLMITLLIQASCSVMQDEQGYAPWDYADLRGMDSVDAPTPSHDLIALYTRSKSRDLQIRLDYLDHPLLPDYDLYLLIDHAPGGSRELPLDIQPDLQWDSLLMIPATGGMQAFDPDFQVLDGAGLQVLRDSVMDTVVISLPLSALGFGSQFENRLPGLRIQAILTPTGIAEPADVIGPISTQGTPPPPLETLFVFWNTLPAYSPGIALRRWDGAHTGPYGGRHGLYNLLRTANSAGIPLALLDIKAPTSLSALDYLGGLELVRQMHTKGLLMLPDYMPDIQTSDAARASQLTEQLLLYNRQTTDGFDLPGSPFLSTHEELMPTQIVQSLVFQRQFGSPEPDATSLAPILRRGSHNVVPIREGGLLANPEQASIDGLTLEARRVFVEAAVESAGSSSVLLLGGDLPGSSWGAPQAARATFHYIRAHPWIRPLDAAALLAARPSQDDRSFTRSDDTDDHPVLPDDLVMALLTLPQNQISRLAWDALQSLYSPVYPQADDLPALRNHYLSNVWSLVSAAKWANDPFEVQSCDLDPDHDGQPECLLVSEHIYTQFEIGSATLTFAFARLAGDPDMLTQWVAPSSQFVVGLSDPSSWDLRRGELADPSVIPGAFSEDAIAYQARDITYPYELIFDDADMQHSKTYTLTTDGLIVAFHSNSEAPTTGYRLPVALTPGGRFSPDWYADYRASSPAPGEWAWSFLGKQTLYANSQTAFNASSFQDSRTMLGVPENPNQELPTGHFLAFPIALIEFNSTTDFRVELKLYTDEQ